MINSPEFIGLLVTPIDGLSGKRVAVNLPLKNSADMRSPPKSKSLCDGAAFPWRLDLQTLGVKLSHGHLQEERVMLKVDRKTELCGN